jgi:hypothetical protein
MSDLMFDVDQAGELKAAFRRGGWTNQEIKRLCEDDMLARVRMVLLDHPVITVPDYLFDLDADPFVPDGWKVEEHQKGCQFKRDAYKVSLYLSAQQKDGKWIEGNKLRRELAGKYVYSANVLDYLLANLHLVPEEWKGKYVFFWGTIYCDPVGRPCVRSLFWNNDRWDWSYRWLVIDWRDHDPAAVAAS